MRGLSPSVSIAMSVFSRPSRHERPPPVLEPLTTSFPHTRGSRSASCIGNILLRETFAHTCMLAICKVKEVELCRSLAQRVLSLVDRCLKKQSTCEATPADCAKNDGWNTHHHIHEPLAMHYFCIYCISGASASATVSQQHIINSLFWPIVNGGIIISST